MNLATISIIILYILLGILTVLFYKLYNEVKKMSNDEIRNKLIESAARLSDASQKLQILIQNYKDDQANPITAADFTAIDTEIKKVEDIANGTLPA